MIDSILDSVKKNLGITEDYVQFDPDIIMYINTAFSTLSQLGVGPVEGFMIEDNSTTWQDYLKGDPRFNMVKSFVYISVKMAFDLPSGRFVLSGLQEQLAELTFRISVEREYQNQGLPQPEIDPVPDQGIVDGGSPSAVDINVFDGGSP